MHTGKRNPLQLPEDELDKIFIHLISGKLLNGQTKLVFLP